jgi:hypothetical protein
MVKVGRRQDGKDAYQDRKAKYRIAQTREKKEQSQTKLL